MADKEAEIAENFMRRIVNLERETTRAARTKREAIAIRLAFDGLTLACRSGQFDEVGRMLKLAATELRASAKLFESSETTLKNQ